MLENFVKKKKRYTDMICIYLPYNHNSYMNSKLFFKVNQQEIFWMEIRGILFWRNVYTCFQKFLTKWESDLDVYTGICKL